MVLRKPTLQDEMNIMGCGVAGRGGGFPKDGGNEIVDARHVKYDIKH